MRLQKNNSLFSVCTIIVALLVMFFIGSAIYAIVAKGIGKLPQVIGSEEVRFSMMLSFGTASVSTALAMLLALPTAYAFTRTDMPLKNVGAVLIELTLSLPYILLGLALLIIFSSPFGKCLKAHGIKIVFSQAGIVMAQLLVNLPYTIRLIRTAIESLDPRMEFVAKTLGATEFQTFRTIMLPQCKSSLISTFILTWSRALGEFGATLMLVGITRMKTETLPGSIYLSITTGNNDTALATAMLMLLVSALTLTVANILNRQVLQKRRGRA